MGARRHAGAFVLGTALLLALPASARADEPAPPGGVDLTQPVPVKTVLEELSRRAKISIVWSSLDERGGALLKPVAARAAFAVRSERVFDAVRALLAQEEIFLYPYGPIADRLYRAADARALTSSFIARLQPEVVEVTESTLTLLDEQGGRYVTATIRLEHLTDAASVRSALPRFLTGMNLGSFIELPSARGFVVTDFAPNVATIYRTLKKLDAPAPTSRDEVETAYFPLKKARALPVAVLLMQLFMPPQGPLEKPVAPPPSPSPSPFPLRTVTDVPPRIAADEASNQIVVVATARDVARIREVVERVDVEPAAHGAASDGAR